MPKVAMLNTKILKYKLFKNNCKYLYFIKNNIILLIIIDIYKIWVD